MKYIFSKKIYRRLLSEFCSSICAVFLAAIPFFALAQTQPPPDGEVVKIAYINYTVLYMSYTGLNQANAKWRQEWTKVNVLFKDKWQLLDEEHQKKIKADSLTGGKQKENLQKETQAKRDSLNASYQENTHYILEQRGKQVDAYQQNIQLALDEIFFKEGYTEVKHLDKGTPISKGNDITDLLLQQLNKKP